ncbi:hypothetical protein [Chryseobacterium taichungense]|uniref:hypothetical protein n=1 Tax=Chryseobacterium taichungense TaxID=295069 RepID=UPI0028ACFE7E|nr:hypothetical protein [Chryseobacterium taichungense]
MANPNINQIGKIQQLIIKNPFAFVASVFFLMFFVTYFINLRANSDSVDYWKKQYEEEKKAKDKLKDELLMKAGYIKEETIKQADSTLRQKTQEQATTLLNQSK